MISITINGEQRELTHSQLGWVTRTVRRLMREGLHVAIRIEIHCGDLNMTLFSAVYPRSSGGGGGRLPNSQESVWFNRWNELGLGGAGFAPNRLTQFLTALLKAC
jgi:hypothetical protein